MFLEVIETRLSDRNSSSWKMMYNNSLGRILNQPMLWVLLVATSARENCGWFHTGELLCGCTDSRLLRVCLSMTTRAVSILDGSQHWHLAGQWTQSWWSFLVSHGGWFSISSSSGAEVRRSLAAQQWSGSHVTMGGAHAVHRGVRRSWNLVHAQLKSLNEIENLTWN